MNRVKYTYFFGFVDRKHYFYNWIGNFAHAQQSDWEREREGETTTAAAATVTALLASMFDLTVIEPNSMKRAHNSDNINKQIEHLTSILQSLLLHEMNRYIWIEYITRCFKMNSLIDWEETNVLTAKLEIPHTQKYTNIQQINLPCVFLYWASETFFVKSSLKWGPDKEIHIVHPYECKKFTLVKLNFGIDG